MSIDNLERMFTKASNIDLEEGMVAYERYHMVMRRLAEFYNFPLERVIAAFVSLSPNNDYTGNLRSTVSILHGIKMGVDVEDITVSTYKHCRNRAYDYARGKREFLSETKGPKIINFYRNVLDPFDNRWVTVDGHMSAIWQGKNLTMKAALIKPRTYQQIKHDLSRLAFKYYILPNQMQAVLWFTRKRIDNVVYDPQLSLFGDRSDIWKTFRDVQSILPYRSKADVDTAQDEQRQRLQQQQAALVDRRGAGAHEGFGSDWPQSEPPQRTRASKADGIRGKYSAR